MCGRELTSSVGVFLRVVCRVAGMAVNTGLVVSVIVSLTSASSGLASVVSERAWERVAASLAIFCTLGECTHHLFPVDYNDFF